MIYTRRCLKTLYARTKREKLSKIENKETRSDLCTKMYNLLDSTFTFVYEPRESNSVIVFLH